MEHLIIMIELKKHKEVGAKEQICLVRITFSSSRKEVVLSEEEYEELLKDIEALNPKKEPEKELSAAQKELNRRKVVAERLAAFSPENIADYAVGDLL